MENVAPQRMKERNIQYANTFLKRSLGLMFKKDFQGEMVFTFPKPTNIFIHTFFMRFDINAVCYNEKNEIVREVKNMKPYRIMYVKNVKYFVEQKATLRR